MNPSSLRALTRKVWLLTTLTGALLAQEKLTSATLANWQSTGAVTANDQTLILPAGAELSRSLPAGSVSVRLVSRPFFSATPTGLPSLEVGPASLTFLRDKDGGALILLGDQPLPLPFSIPLDQGGYSLAPLDITFSYDPTAAKAKLQLADRSYEQSASAATGTIDVTLAAGGSVQWTIDTLEVTATSDLVLSTSANVSLSQSGNSVSLPSAREVTAAKVEAMRNSRELFAQGDDDGAEKLLLSLNRHSEDSAGWHMESAAHLVSVAFAFHTRGDPRTAAKIAWIALGHLTQTEQKHGSTLKPGEAANLKELAAVIRERLLGNTDAACDDYAAAARLAPQSGQAAERLALLTAQRRSASADRSTLTITVNGK